MILAHRSGSVVVMIIGAAQTQGGGRADSGSSPLRSGSWLVVSIVVEASYALCVGVVLILSCWNRRQTTPSLPLPDEPRVTDYTFLLSLRA